MKKTIILIIITIPLLFMSCPGPDPISELPTDTTSHDFIWEIDTLGKNGSYLNDVAIVDSNNIWVVGMIKTDTGDYNAGHWDGEKWELMKILLGGTGYAIEYFSKDNIWIILEGMPTHWNGLKWTFYHLQNMGLNISILKALWGTSSDNMYFVGNNGSIVHYDGTDFEKMKSGRDTRLIDVAGSENGEYVFVAGTKIVVPESSIALEIKNNQINELYYTTNINPAETKYGNIKAVSICGDIAYMATGGGLWKYNYKKQKSELISDNGLYELSCQSLIVQNHNDILWIFGIFGYTHFNGIDWERIIIDYDFYLNSGKLQNNLAILVGNDKNLQYALIAKGKR